jgi:hypothetical protein
MEAVAVDVDAVRELVPDFGIGSARRLGGL